jgi:hypothetical protein
MRSSFTWTRRNIQAILAFSLLAFQVSIPWTVPDFVTQDGPSHLYTAIVARNLLLHPHSEYGKVYALNNHLVPNWGSAVVIGLITSIAGVVHAEQIFTTLAVTAGFFAFAYAIRAVAPEAKRWTPLTNFLLQSWFLWVGYYNFYLAMVLCPLLIGYYIRHASALTVKRAITLACGMCALFLTHLIPAALAGLTIVLTAAWVNLVAPRLLSGARPTLWIGVRHMVPVVLALVPALILFLGFAGRSKDPIDFTPRVVWALENFPMHVFVTSSGRAGDQSLLVPAVLCFIVLAMLTMRRADWQTARGGLAVATVAAFLLYLLVPNSGLGGTEAKIRFSWGVFVLGGLLLATARRLRPWRLPFDIYVFGLLICTLVSTERTLLNYSDAVEDYLGATKLIPQGARLVRLRYPTPDLPAQYGFSEIGRDPLFHLDSYVAVRNGCLDLTDYQAPSNIFPVVFNRKVPAEQRRGLWSLEGPGPDADEILKSLQFALPGPADYVIMIADQSTPGVDNAEFKAVQGLLNSETRLVRTSSHSPFVRVYQRIAP